MKKKNLVRAKVEGGAGFGRMTSGSANDRV